MRTYHSINSLKGILIAKARTESPAWVYGFEFDKVGMEAGYRGETIPRQLRDMSSFKKPQDMWLEKNLDEPKRIKYKFIHPKEQEVIHNLDGTVTIN